MLYIEHIPLVDGFPTDDGFRVDVKIKAYSGQNLVAEGLNVEWRLEGESSWNSVPLQLLASDFYYAYIPPQPSGATVEYYITTLDESGFAENRL